MHRGSSVVYVYVYSLLHSVLTAAKASSDHKHVQSRILHCCHGYVISTAPHVAGTLVCVRVRVLASIKIKEGKVVGYIAASWRGAAAAQSVDPKITELSCIYITTKGI